MLRAKKFKNVIIKLPAPIFTPQSTVHETYCFRLGGHFVFYGLLS